MKPDKCEKCGKRIINPNEDDYFKVDDRFFLMCGKCAAELDKIIVEYFGEEAYN